MEEKKNKKEKLNYYIVPGDPSRGIPDEKIYHGPMPKERMKAHLKIIEKARKYWDELEKTKE